MTSNFYPVLINCNIIMLQCVLNLQENSLFAALTSFSVLPYHVSLYLMSCLYISLYVWVAKTSLMKTLPFTLFFPVSYVLLTKGTYTRYIHKRDINSLTREKSTTSLPQHATRVKDDQRSLHVTSKKMLKGSNFWYLMECC